MNFDAISAISQVVGLIVVVGSLIYIAIQTRQAKQHAAAAAEISFIEGINGVLGDWAADERTSTVIREGFATFKGLSKDDQALFHMRVGALVNQLVLAESLSARGLLGKRLSDEIRKLTISVLSTDGGLQYWEYDSKATPRGLQLLDTVKQARGKQLSITELLPWWSANDAPLDSARNNALERARDA